LVECKVCGLPNHEPNPRFYPLHQYFQEPSHDKRTQNVYLNNLWREHLHRLHQELIAVRAEEQVDRGAELQKSRESLTQANRARTEELRQKYNQKGLRTELLERRAKQMTEKETAKKTTSAVPVAASARPSASTPVSPSNSGEVFQVSTTRSKAWWQFWK
jgi:hypothetical protein